MCGSDINLIFMKDSPTAMPFTSFPCVPGHEFCGDVVETGREVKICKKGDLVTVIPALNCDTRGDQTGMPELRRGNYRATARISPKARSRRGCSSESAKTSTAGLPSMWWRIKARYTVCLRACQPESAALTEPLAVGLQAVLDNMPDDRIRCWSSAAASSVPWWSSRIRALGSGCDITVVEPSPFAAEYAKKSGADRTIGGGIIEAAVEIAGGRPTSRTAGRTHRDGRIRQGL